MHLSAQKEQFSVAYTHAVATVSGVAITSMTVDDDSVDIGLARKGVGLRFRSPRLDVQLKCTSQDVLSEGQVSIELKRKNYEELRSSDFMVPRILVVMLVPKQVSEWLTHLELESSIRNGAWWTSLQGAHALPAEQKSKVVKIPRSQVFNSDTLAVLMDKAARGEFLAG